MDLAPSMVQRSGDKLIVRRVVSGERVHLSESPVGGSPTLDDEDTPQHQQQLMEGWRQEFADRSLGSITLRSPVDESEGDSTPGTPQDTENERQLPQCKIKRNYSCGRCAYFTQNPREYLTHLRDTHGEKIVINECKRCLYASRHYQKLVRHMKMVHGSVDGIRKSAFGSRRRVQRGYLGGGVPGKLLRSSEAERLTSAYVQQLVASGLPKLLEEIEKAGASTSLGTNSFTRNNTIHLDLEQLNKSLPYSPEKKTVLEASEGDRRERGENPPTTSETEDDAKTKKRSRPIPNLIPLSVSPVPSTSAGSGQRFVKPLPLSALTAQPESKREDHSPAQEFPISLTKHEPAMTDVPEETHNPGTKCIYCDLAFKTVEALANHIKLAHKEDLIAYLLAHSFEEAEAKGRAMRQAEVGQANETWRRLVEGGSVVDAAVRREEDTTEARNLVTQVQPTTNDDTDDDSREGDGHPHQAQTFCGVETAPGYGEVTNRIPCVDPTAGGTALMKKVFKCPHCSFWASTASRFHVHIVGHLNKKPFECSLCAYRSNWRWDITKHIRLKTIRDPSHKNACVLMNDETGRRNYTKYNKYVALMQITDK
ncbi:uncharacterized protein LOC131290341 [Anopheles ziemanni]|uniref:uncharacterized protein LOC131266960 n=1 Tax=Anopheles coustani TaxID=139045 RepID=UPI002658FA51|nr:uncharacterized protein LOC131266960 [Anopheles coustani]XP_058175511.1 uncharacterized protein LOC131290341 [Anopheles ziemanni]